MNQKTLSELSEQLEQALSQTQIGEDSSHDVFHARRVKQNAYAIAELEGDGDIRMLTAAAYLHDLINVPKNAPNRDQASRLSAQAAAPILSQLGFGDDEVNAIQHCIEDVLYSWENGV